MRAIMHKNSLKRYERVGKNCRAGQPGRGYNAPIGSSAQGGTDMSVSRRTFIGGVAAALGYVGVRPDNLLAQQGRPAAQPGRDRENRLTGPMGSYIYMRHG
jgi:hypothetical protein